MRVLAMNNEMDNKTVNKLNKRLEVLFGTKNISNVEINKDLNIGQFLLNLQMFFGQKAEEKSFNIGSVVNVLLSNISLNPNILSTKEIYNYFLETGTNIQQIIKSENFTNLRKNQMIFALLIGNLGLKNTFNKLTKKDKELFSFFAKKYEQKTENSISDLIEFENEQKDLENPNILNHLLVLFLREKNLNKSLFLDFFKNLKVKFYGLQVQGKSIISSLIQNKKYDELDVVMKDKLFEKNFNPFLLQTTKSYSQEIINKKLVIRKDFQEIVTKHNNILDLLLEENETRCEPTILAESIKALYDFNLKSSETFYNISLDEKESKSEGDNYRLGNIKKEIKLLNFLTSFCSRFNEIYGKSDLSKIEKQRVEQLLNTFIRLKINGKEKFITPLEGVENCLESLRNNLFNFKKEIARDKMGDIISILEKTSDLMKNKFNGKTLEQLKLEPEFKGKEKIYPHLEEKIKFRFNDKLFLQAVFTKKALKKYKKQEKRKEIEEKAKKKSEKEKIKKQEFRERLKIAWKKIKKFFKQIKKIIVDFISRELEIVAKNNRRAERKIKVAVRESLRVKSLKQKKTHSKQRFVHGLPEKEKPSKTKGI